MTIESEEVTTTLTYYIAEDGTKFTTVYDCMRHEWNAQATVVYAVSSRGSRSDEPELYSTKELAEQAVGSSTIHIITKVYLDERFWNAKEDLNDPART